MALPTTRAEFKESCLRKLGKPVIEINVDDDQVEDRIDEAIQYYWDYHFDGSEKIYYKYQVTDQDKQNGYITLPENIIGAINLFEMNSWIGVNNIFSIQYQIALNELYTITSISAQPYYMTMAHLAFLQELLIGKKPLRYNRNMNRLYVDMAWDLVPTGNYIIVEAYQVVDPTIYADVWKDRWLLRYAAALIKQQWGTNLKKFDGMKMPGGLTFNGQKIYDEATAEREQLEQEMISSYSLPVTDMIG